VTAAPVRVASRVLVLDPQQRLLLRGAGGHAPGPVQCWCTPGGVLADGESLRAAAVRELAEELGLAVAAGDLEGPVWFRRQVLPEGGEPVDTRETYFVLRDVDLAVGRGGRPDDGSYRWWSLAEIGAGAETFAPRELAEVLPAVLSGPRGGPPRVVE